MRRTLTWVRHRSVQLPKAHQTVKQSTPMMMREEISNGMAEIEGRMLQNMTVTMDTLKAELRAEAAAREQLEARLATLEQQYASGGTHVHEDEGVDKSIAVIGGFRDCPCRKVRSRLGLHILKAVPMRFAAGTPVGSRKQSRTERYRSKAASKLKKFLIEIGGRAPKDVLVNYQCFKVVVRHNSKLMPVAFISSDLEVSWVNADIIDDGVKEALGE
ncbi:unnamed protein product [Durusdinium trenchii]|uniref:Uncharacterized protein n=1 Tax=Durusdinium trenchii TaxID=1381693 RepID=A0ABP0L8U0_9DINO